jgi:5,10-methylenetetrahydromethanopterin reductase
MRAKFGITFLPNAPSEFVEWCRTAEATGFDIIGIADSQSLYREVYVCCTLCALNTERIRFGPRVITPLTRHPAVAASAALTLEELAPGRTILGIGTGDSAVYNIGLKGSTQAELREYLLAVRALQETGVAEYHGRTARLTWGRAKIPIYIAASGPKTLRLAGEIANGVVINTGLLPEIVRDSIEHVRAGALAAGRDPSEIDMWWLPLTNLRPDRQAAIDEIKMSLASAGSHLSRFTTEGKHIPPELMERVKALGARYHFDEHDKPESANRRLIEELGLVEYVADRFAVAGPAEDCIAKLGRAIDAGARQFWMSVHFDDKVRFMREWGEKVIPAFR